MAMQHFVLSKFFMESILRACLRVRNKRAFKPFAGCRTALIAVHFLSKYATSREECAMRRTRILIPCLAVALALSAGPLLAEEIIYFKNGSSMPIMRHEVRGDMIHVDLGSNSFLAFPMSQVEKIEAAGDGVQLTPSSGAGNNIMSGSRPDPSDNPPVRGTAPSAYDRRANRKLPIERVSEDPNVEMDADTGVAVYRPFKHSQHPAKRMLGAAGHQRVFNAPSGGPGQGGIVGSHRVGKRHVIGGNEPSNFRSGGGGGAARLAQTPRAPSRPQQSDSGGSSQGSSSSGSGSGD
jgi:hypothetical protein